MLESFLYNPIALIFLSYAFGAWGMAILKAGNWHQPLSDQHYISDTLTKNLGVLHFKWLIRHSFMGMFNKNLVYSGKAKQADLSKLKEEMTFAEIGHLIAFIILSILCLVLFFFNFHWWYILSLFILNIIFNGYLVFLQQYNKRRIDAILRRQEQKNQ